MKLERNEKCICGSGEKNKICCNIKEIDDDKFYELLLEISNQSLSYDEKLLLESIQRLETFLNYSHLSKDNELQIKLNLIGAYQRRGLHNDSLSLISEIELSKLNTGTYQYSHLLQLKAKSLSAIEEFELATETLDLVIEDLLLATDNSEGAGPYLVEASKIYINGNQIEKAKKCLENAVTILKDDKREIEHYERAKSNQAILMLNDENEEIVKKGVELINKSIYAKSKIGDLEGLGTNYCNLGIHYWKKENFKGAIAYLRKDLWITRKIGDLHGIAISLRNLTSLYLVLKQYKKARRLAKESVEIGNQIEDQAIIDKAEFQLKQITDFSKSAGIAKEPIGENAPCACGSGKIYEECCGVADHEPIEFPYRFSGVSEELENVTMKFKKSSRLDFIFRDTMESEGRLAWTQVEIKTGWYKLSELPDMANIYLLSAKEILNGISSNNDSIHNPLSCLILSVSALEAYINQVAYFLDDIKNFPESNLHTIPEEFNTGVIDFQRNTELTLKWSILGKCICEEMWSPKQSLWYDFKVLISIRNEFIHFKLSEYEQVIPTPKKQHPILKKLPKYVEIREVHHSWPMRVLTPSLAKWSVETSEKMIKYFKNQYEQKRIKAHSSNS